MVLVHFAVGAAAIAVIYFSVVAAVYVFYDLRHWWRNRR